MWVPSCQYACAYAIFRIGAKLGAWAKRMFEEAHKREGKKWAQHHATHAQHMLVWGASGVGSQQGAEPHTGI